MDRMMTCTVEGCAMCAGSSCATCNADGLVSSCAHDVFARHRGRQRLVDRREQVPTIQVPTKPLPDPLLADRIEVDPADPDSVANFLETWAQIVRTRRRFIIILQ
jgi:tRNA(Arg) A34 adenosine deaminase TadA